MRYKPDDEFSSFFVSRRYTSAGFYTQTGIMYSTLNGLVFPCSEGVAEGSCPPSGDVILASMGITQIKLIPTYALMFLTCGSMLLSVALVVAYVRPFHRKSTVIPKDVGFPTFRQRVSTPGGGSNDVFSDGLAAGVLELRVSTNPMHAPEALPVLVQRSPV